MAALLFSHQVAELLWWTIRWQSHAMAAKAAIDSLTRSMALEWGEFGIRVWRLHLMLDARTVALIGAFTVGWIAALHG